LNEGKLNVGTKDVCEIVVGIFQEQYIIIQVLTNYTIKNFELNSLWRLQYHMNECCFAAHPESLPISHEPWSH
jgi:hypothetical protein